MPTFRITTPDGKTYTVNAPEGATAQDALAKIKASTSSRPSSGSGLVDQTLSSINEFLIGVPTGIYNMASGVTDPIMRHIVGDDAVDKAVQQRKDVVDKVSHAVVSRPSPVARTTGEIAATIPLGGIKAPAAIAKVAPKLAPIVTRGVQGALGGLAVRDQDAPPGESAAIGAASNIILPPLISKAAGYVATRPLVQRMGATVTPLAQRYMGAIDDASGKAYDAIAPKIGLSGYMPQPSPVAAAIEPAAVKPVEAALGKAADARMRNFKSLGINSPTTGMVTRDPRVWTAERELAKSEGHGDELLRRFQDVDKGIENAARTISAKRGPAANAEETGIAVQRALDTKRAEMQNFTSQLYRQVRDAKGDVSVGSLQTFRDALDDPNMIDNPTFDTMLTGVNRRLQRFGMAGQSGLLRKDAVATVSQAEELRKLIGNLGDGKDPATRYMRGKLIEALDEDVVAAHGDDAFREARASAKARFDEFGKSFAGKVADNAVKPEKLTQNVLAAGSSLADVRSLKQSLFTGTDEQIARGMNAWNGVGSRALNDLFEGSRLADGRLSGASLTKGFNKAAPKLRILLEPAEFKQLQKLVAATRDATIAVPFSAVNNSNTASALGNMFAPDKPQGRGIIKNILGHVAAFTTAGPAGNIALRGAQETAATMAERKAAQATVGKIRMALDPDAAANAILSAEDSSSRDAAIRAGIDRGKNFAGDVPGLIPALMLSGRERR